VRKVALEYRKIYNGTQKVDKIVKYFTIVTFYILSFTEWAFYELANLISSDKFFLMAAD
jgi:hypothetical protein